MNQATYLSSLKRALSGLPAAEVADVLADCERYFIDGLASGRDESAVAAGLGDPRKMAAELRAAIGMAAFEKKRSFGNLLRLVSVTAGLVSFNVAMLVPALILPLLVLSSYLLAATTLVAGVFITLSGVTSIDHVGLVADRAPIVQGPGATMRDHSEWLRLDVGNLGVNVSGPGIGDAKIGAGRAVPDEARPFTRWRILYGALYLLVGFVLWPFSGKIGRALVRGSASYLRLNRTLIKDAVARRSFT